MSPHPPSTRGGEDLRRAFALAALVLLAVAAFEAASLYRFYLAQSRLPQWDMAGHGWGGVELLRALEQGRPLHFLDLLNRQDKWPFGYSLLLLPFLAAGNASLASATVLSTVLFALVPLALLSTAREVDAGPAGLWAGLIAAALFLASPLSRLFAILIMRETAGIFFSLLALGLYLRARRLGTSRAWRLAGLAFLALFLVKYNYALVLALAVLANEFWRLPSERRRELTRGAARLLRPWGQPSRGRIVLAVYLDLLIAAALLGINPGVGVYAGLVIGAVVVAVRCVRDREKLHEDWRRLPLEVRAGLATVIVPLWVWCLSPDPVHPKNIFAFLRNRAAGPPLFSLESLTFYFRSLMRDFAPEPSLGALVIVLFFTSLGGSWKWRDEPFRVLLLAAFLGLGLATFHPYKEPRFLAVTAPYLMLLAAVTLSRTLHGRKAAPPLRLAVAGLFCAGAVAGVGLAAARPDLDARLARDYKLYSARPGFWRPLAFLVERAAGAERLAVVGTFNELSDSLVRWRLAQQGKTRSVTVVDSLSRFAADLPAEEVHKRLRSWLDRERPERILAVRLLPSSRLFRGRDFQSFNAWQLVAVAALEETPAWRVQRRKRFPALELEILVLDPATSPPSRPTARSPSPRRR